MSSLVVCPSCNRHIRRTEMACPFCDGAVSAAVASTPERPMPTTRLGRAALVAFAAASTGAVACGGETIGRGGTGDGESGGSAGAGAGGFLSAPPYGISPFMDGGNPGVLYGLVPPPDAGGVGGAGGTSPVGAGGASPRDAGTADSGLNCIDDFGGGVPSRCCPNPVPDCKGKPDGYPGYSCTPAPRSFCSCSCSGGQWVCGC